jgi:hypothetical protein
VQSLSEQLLKSGFSIESSWDVQIQLFDNEIYDKCLSNLEESKAAIKEKFESVYEKDEYDTQTYIGEKNMGYTKEDQQKRLYIDQVKNHTIKSVYLIRVSEFPKEVFSVQQSMSKLVTKFCINLVELPKV